jgi:predicted permease
MGRTFTQQEDEGFQQVAVISYQMWNSRFHGDMHILGQTIQLQRRPYEIIGVMPRDFEFPLVPGQLNRSELWVPMSFTQGELVNGAGSWNYRMVGRLKPGVTPTQALQDAQPAVQEIMRGFPPAMGSLRIHPLIQPLTEATVAQARPLVRTLFLAVAVVLFIACANLAGLLLVRVIRRRREISLRLALGASGAAVLRHSLVEALLLSVAGGLLGLALASVVLRAGVSLLPESLPRVSAIGLDWKVVGFALLLALLTGLLCGLIPAIAAARTGVNEALKEGGPTGSAGGGHARLRSALVVAELAVALVLLTASGLLLRPRTHRLVWLAIQTIRYADRRGRFQCSSQPQTATVAGRASGWSYLHAARGGAGQQRYLCSGRLRSPQGRRLESGLGFPGDGRLLSSRGYPPAAWPRFYGGG